MYVCDADIAYIVKLTQCGRIHVHVLDAQMAAESRD